MASRGWLRELPGSDYTDQCNTPASARNEYLDAAGGISNQRPCVPPGCGVCAHVWGPFRFPEIPVRSGHDTGWAEAVWTFDGAVVIAARSPGLHRSSVPRRFDHRSAARSSGEGRTADTLSVAVETARRIRVDQDPRWPQANGSLCRFVPSRGCGYPPTMCGLPPCWSGLGSGMVLVVHRAGHAPLPEVARWIDAGRASCRRRGL